MKKTIDYILGFITGCSVMLAFWGCTQSPLQATGSGYSDVLEVKIVNESWDAVYVREN
tara:strand:- start:87 stop:260 length:174 start_codon:yes stop_codon:yes gene_type:complete